MISDIGIVDAKKIMAAVANTHGVDLSGLALTALRRRVLHAAGSRNIASVTDLVARIESSRAAYEELLSDSLVEETEMFRDPSFWRELRDNQLPALLRTNKTINVLMPGVVTGDEALSMLILIHEANLDERVNLTLTTLSQKRLETLRAGVSYDTRKMEISEANYKRFADKGDINNYFDTRNGRMHAKPFLAERAKTLQASPLADDPAGGQHLIVYRNQMIFFNTPLQDKVSQRLFDALEPGGLLCVGAKENLDNAPFARKLTCVSKNERIYKKHLA